MRLKLKRSIALFLFGIFALMFTVSCQQPGKGSATPPPVAGIPCPVGQIGYNGGCVVPPYTGSTQIQYYSSKEDPHSPTDTLVPDAYYKDFLKYALGVCERCENSGGEILKCSSWQNGFNLIRLEFVPNLTDQLRVHFYTTPKLTNPYFQYAWSFPKVGDFFLALLGAPIPSCNYGQQTPYWYESFNLQINSPGTGFTIYGNGPLASQWNRHAIRIQITDGNIGDNSFSYQMYAYTDKNQKINLSHGKFQKCLSTNCGMF